MIATLSTYFKNIIPEISSLIILIISLYNNPYRFSAEKNFINLAHHKMTYLLYFIIVILQLLILYCKSFTYLNYTQFFSITLPFFLLFVPFIGLISVMFISNQVFIYKYEHNKKLSYMPQFENSEIHSKDVDKDISADGYVDNKEYSSPPSYFLTKKIRILIFIFNLIFALISVYMFVNYLYKSKEIYRSPLQKLLTKSPTSHIAKNIILTLLGLLIFIYLFLLYQQMTFYPCQLGLPESWDI